MVLQQPEQATRAHFPTAPTQCPVLSNALSDNSEKRSQLWREKENREKRASAKEKEKKTPWKKRKTKILEAEKANFELVREIYELACLCSGETQRLVLLWRARSQIPPGLVGPHPRSHSGTSS